MRYCPQHLANMTFTFLCGWNAIFGAEINLLHIHKVIVLASQLRAFEALAIFDIFQYVMYMFKLHCFFLH